MSTGRLHNGAYLGLRRFKDGKHFRTRRANLSEACAHQARVEMWCPRDEPARQSGERLILALAPTPPLELSLCLSLSLLVGPFVKFGRVSMMARSYLPEMLTSIE